MRCIHANMVPSVLDKLNTRYATTENCGKAEVIFRTIPYTPNFFKMLQELSAQINISQNVYKMHFKNSWNGTFAVDTFEKLISQLV